GRHHDGDALDDLEAVSLEPHQLHGIVGEHANRGEPQIEQDLRPDAVVAQIGLEPELAVRLDRVVPRVLQLVRLELVEEADPPPFLIEVYHDAAAFGRDHPHGGVQLPAAIAPPRAEHVAGETFG